MTFPRALLVLAILLAAQTAFAVEIGASRAQVLRSLGEPAARATRGDREIFVYPRGGRIEFLDGRVVEADGPLPAPAMTRPPAPPQLPKAAPPVSAPIPQTKPSAAPESGAEKLVDQLEANSNPMAASQKLGQQLEKMNTAMGGQLSIPVPSPATSRTRGIRWPKFFAGLILHLGITLLALRIAFRIEEMDAFWSGTFAIASIDLALYGALEALGPATSGISSMVVVEGGVCALAMVVTIQKFCFNKRLQNAVVTAMAVKTIVQLCDMFVFPLALHAMFG